MTQAPYDKVKNQLLDAALLHVPFDGWSEATFMAAIAESGIETGLARSICPRGAVDLAIEFHHRGDAAMVARLKSAKLGELRFRDKIATAVQYRIEVIEDKEAVRRGTALFALPQHATDGAKLIWGTCDLIWDTLGDTSDDINWYTKRATLSGVYGSTILYWLGDDSVGNQATWDFLNRRIDNVMQFEKIKAQVNDNPILKQVFAGPNWVLSKVKAPSRMPRVDLPGSWNGPN
ncbi:COQ9 family protein [Parasulfitobacter algicola]|uniref:COQ9 family protein n=1 Tax=Parasulfitobacter algicola TaxID=2614809 RepID=A0ABX2ILG5_9RHOB|nr:COQ9 family protein [Sulfitobacter algicola]NSX53717.1 COQ9 family protein [Sulfitobacter algicola]